MLYLVMGVFQEELPIFKSWTLKRERLKFDNSLNFRELIEKQYQN
jgi:hypothetical protein